MGKTVPMASFRRAAARPDADAVAAFIQLGDAPPPAPVPVAPTAVIDGDAPAAASAPAVVVDDAATKEQEPLPVIPVSDRAKASSNQGRPTKWRRKTLVRTDGRELRKQTFYLDAELSHRLMVTCASLQYEMSEAIEEAVSQWLKKKC